MGMKLAALFNLRPIEILLIEFIFYTLLWLWNDYIASLVSIILLFIFVGILIVAIISELIEPSKVPRSYFYFMLVSILAPILAALLFVGLMDGQLEWLEG